LKKLTQHFVPGHSRQAPAGLISLTTNDLRDPDRGPYFDADGRLPDDGIITYETTH